MFEGIRGALAAWREVLHISEWSGLSIGALAGLGALFYFVPLARKLAVVIAINVLIAWACLIHGDQVGRADLQKQWDEARVEAAKEQADRDSKVALELDQKYRPKLAELQKQSDDRKKQVDDYESKILSLWTAGASGPAKTAKPAADHCLLGAAALRLRQRQ